MARNHINTLFIAYVSGQSETLSTLFLNIVYMCLWAGMANIKGNAKHATSNLLIVICVSDFGCYLFSHVSIIRCALRVVKIMKHHNQKHFGMVDHSGGALGGGDKIYWCCASGFQPSKLFWADLHMCCICSATLFPLMVSTKAGWGGWGPRRRLHYWGIGWCVSKCTRHMCTYALNNGVTTFLANIEYYIGILVTRLFLEVS